MNIESKFYQELLPNERFLWTGQPDTGIVFAKGDLFYIPFSLVWSGFMIFAFSNIFTSTASIDSLIIPFIFAVFGFYALFGRFIYKHFKKKHTYYAVTDKRALIRSDFMGTNSLQTVNPRTVSAINKTVNNGGSGSIVFGEQNQQTEMSANMGLDLFGRGNAVPAFYDIQNVEEVYEKLKRRD